MSASVLFVSTVREWGGSEILWAETASRLADKKHKIGFAIRYAAPAVQKLTGKGAIYINIAQRSSLLYRAMQKLKLKKHPFLQALLKLKPQLVVISQGNNIDAGYYMTLCRQRSVPYVTIAQLVTNILWAFIDDNKLNELRLGYADAQRNYFVSSANLALHNTMIGDQHANARFVLNPVTVPADVKERYPPLLNGKYCIALVGRLETFHKGHDLLLDVLKQSKWKDRPVVFNFYGKGPHKELLERLIKNYGISNVNFKGYVSDVASVWKENHLLVMPSRMEGQALALIEAMWCNRSAVVTDVGGARDLMIDGETAFIADFPNSKEIDTALEKAWSFRERWEELGKNAGRRIREIYNEDPVAAFATELEKVLDNLHR